MELTPFVEFTIYYVRNNCQANRWHLTQTIGGQKCPTPFASISDVAISVSQANIR